MTIKTGKITFNVTRRGRKHRGQERNFDTAAMCALVNSGEVQERVKHRDMYGYYGHWPRLKFGMNPSEGGIVDGKQIAIEPALITTHLKALPDGTIEHETEFLDNPSGKLAARLFASKTGGWSSAIDIRKVAGKDMPTGFYGFDYVLEPNFTGNRGYELALDSVEGETFAIMDEVAQRYADIDAMNRVFDSLQSAYDMQAEALKRVELENAELLSMLTKGGRGKTEVRLDGLNVEILGVRPDRFINSASMFAEEALIGREEIRPEETPADAKGRKQTSDYMNRRFRV